MTGDPTPRKRRFLRRSRVYDMPEVRLFNSEADANDAIAEINHEVNRDTGTWLTAFALGAVAIVAYYGLNRILARILTTVAPQTVGWITLAIVTLAICAFSFWAVRVNYPKLIRSKLNERGIRVCMKCGYDLRGKPDEPRCPECGAKARDPVTPTS